MTPDKDGYIFTDGAKCPNCGCWFSTGEGGSWQRQTDSEFHEFPDPHYAWVEFHKCTKCETLYKFKNGT